MRHVKLPALMTPAEKLARVASGASDTARSALTRRSGTIYVPNADGVTGTIIGPGAGSDGTGTAQGVAPWVGDTTPPGRPTGVTATSSGGVVVATWDGTLEGGVPADFAFVRVYASDGSSGERLLGELTGAGSCPAADFAAGSAVEVWAVAYDAARDRTGALARNASEPSETVEVEVVDASADAITETYEEYAVSPSRAEAPTEGWSREPPPASAEGVVWRRTVTITGDGMATRSTPVPLTGEPGVTLSIEADGGTVLRNSAGSTTLSAVVYQGAAECRTLAEVRAAFGRGASVEWSELGPSGWEAIGPDDPRLSEGGMALTADGQDISGQATYRCCLVVIDENGVTIYGN